MPDFSDMLKIVRLKYPNTVKDEIFTAWPMDPPKIKSTKPFREMVIRGGLVHDFVWGYQMTPYTLGIETGTLTEYESGTILRAIASKEILETSDGLTEEKQIEWSSRIQEFNKEQNESIR